MNDEFFSTDSPLKKIVITGPESSGKTTLAAALAAHFAADWSPEFARTYLHFLSRDYTQQDLPAIARGQIAQENWYQRQNPEWLFCDTDLTVLHVWHLWKYGETNPFIEEQMFARRAGFYLLCLPDLPWQPDPLRESREHLQALFTLYEKTLQQLDAPYGIVRGQGSERLQNALFLLQHLK